MAADRTSKKRARPEAISPNGSDDQVLSTANMPIRTAKDAALGEVGLVDFLQDDPRPTCIVDTTAGYIAYRNPALERLLAGAWNLQHFRDWATALSPQSQPAAYGGRAWNCILQNHKWLIASADQEVPVAPSPSPVTHRAAAPVRSSSQNSINTRATSQHSNSNSNPNTGTSSSDSRRQSIASSSWRTVSDEGGQRYLDWTRIPSPAMSAHMHLIRNFPWQDTTIGSMHSWPDALRQAVLSIMANPDPRLLLWGDDHIMIYNEACISMFGARHPRALGSRAEDTWSDIWSDMQHLIKYVQTEGRGTRLNKLPLVMERHGYPEDTFWSFNLIPIIGPNGNTIGVIDEFSEVTEQVVSDRRRDAIVRINKTIARVNSVKELWFEFLEGLEPCKDDIPYALLYTNHAAATTDPSIPDSISASSGSSPQRFALEGSIGLAAGHPAVPLTFDLADCANDQNPLARACYKAWKSDDVVVLQLKDASLPEVLNQGVPGRASGDKVQTVCILPLPDMTGHHTMAFLTLAMTPRRPYDSEAAMFAYYLRDILVKSASAICLPEEQRRARQKFEQIEASLAQQLRATTLETERLESRFARMAQLAPIGMYAITPDSRTTFYNKAYLDITGITEGSIEAQTDPAEYVHPNDRERVNTAWLQCLEDKQSFTIEYRVSRAWSFTDPISGETFEGDTYVLATAAPEMDEDGNITHVQGWLLDVSDRKYHEKIRIQQIEVEQSETKFARLAADAPLGMYLLKPNGEPLYLNDAYFEILGFTREEFEEAQQRGLGWGDRIHEDDQPKVGEAWMALAERGIPLNLEYRIKKPWKYIDEATGLEMSGETWLQGTAIAEIGIDGSVVAIQGFVTEISLKKASERLLSEKLEDALEHKRQADRFIDMTSHEMRNPLSAILQSADGILTTLENNNRLGITSGITTFSGDVLETVLDAAQTIILCAQHQGRIVDDILTLSKLDSNLLVVSPDTVDMPSLLEKCFKMHEAELIRAKIGISLRIHEDFRNLAVGRVMLDSSRLLQVIINLLTNAIKFTQFASRKEITVHLDASLTRPKVGMYGAPYVPFRVNRPEHHFTAEWGTGEEIFVSIAVQDSGKGMNEEELKLLFNRFSQASPKTYKQYGGSGLGLFISRELTDLQDGQIGVHSEPDKGSTFSFYIKARRAVDDDETVLEGRLITPTLNTPVTYTRDSASNTLEATVDKVQHDKTQNVIRKMSAMSHDLTEEKPHLHVLVVEDNVINQRVMAQQLRRLGCTVHLANHGLEALDFIRKTSFWAFHPPPTLNEEAPSPRTVPQSNIIPLSVVLMDLEMPVLGGLETVKRIRSLQSEGSIISHIPVIAVTANARSEQIAVAIDHGMDSVVTKPFRIPELVPQMEDLVKRVQQGRIGRSSVMSVVKG
ncbi:histidine kinase, partial [Aureobasidium melanogenum]